MIKSPCINVCEFDTNSALCKGCNRNAFEIFTNKSLKEDNGQFFTPRNVISFMVHFLKPNYKHKIIDPASIKVQEQYEEHPYPRWRYTTEQFTINFIDQLINENIKLNIDVK